VTARAMASPNRSDVEHVAWQGVTALPQGCNWLVLPDRLCVEILPVTGNSVAAALAIDPRA